MNNIKIVRGNIFNTKAQTIVNTVIASANERVFTKTPGKGLYIAFKYNILEVEVESSNESL